MDKITKKIAVILSVIVFFAMALTGLICHRPITTCCARSVSGAIIAYVIITFAVRAVFMIIIHAMANQQKQ